MLITADHETWDIRGLSSARDALAAGHSPLVTITSKYPRMVARISNDAFIPLSKARQLAADADLHVNF